MHISNQGIINIPQAQVRRCKKNVHAENVFDTLAKIVRANYNENEAVGDSISRPQNLRDDGAQPSGTPAVLRSLKAKSKSKVAQKLLQANDSLVAAMRQWPNRHCKATRLHQ